MDPEIKAKKKTNMANLRWKILSKAIRHGASSVLQSDLAEGSNRFSCFGLIQLIPETRAPESHVSLTNGSNNSMTTASSNENAKCNLLVNNNNIKPKSTSINGNWYQCRNRGSQESVLDIRLLNEEVPLSELFGTYDNTGNVCLWPSEEILAHYCLMNREISHKKVVLELGGGQTCLSGLMVAATCAPEKVIVTDGNFRCVSNVENIIERNKSRFMDTRVECRQLRWTEDINSLGALRNSVDLILCADCLYLTEGRSELVDTICALLSDDGLAIILAPLRGDSFQAFVSIASKILDTEQVMVYDKSVWAIHEQFVKSAENGYSNYQPDIHYPRMIVLQKEVKNKQSMVRGPSMGN